MINGMFGPGTTIGILRNGLDESASMHRGIQDQIANARTPGAGADFGAALDAQLAGAAQEEVDLLSQMAWIADNQARFDAAAVLAQKAYGQFRIAVRNA